MQLIDLVKPGTGFHLDREVHVDAQTAGDGGPVVLVLTGTELVREDADFVAALGERHRVMSVSHPGFGRSAQPDWCTSVADLADLYEAWLERSGHTDVTLVGLQFGGWVALELAVRRSPAISRLVLVDSVGVKLGGTTDRDFVDVFATPRDRVERLIYADPSRALGVLETADELDVLEVMRNEEALARYAWAPYLHDPRLRRLLDRIDTPTLVVWGAEDGIVSPDYGRRLADEIPGARFELVPDAGHRPQVERAAHVANLVADFTA